MHLGICELLYSTMIAKTLLALEGEAERVLR